MRRRFSRLPFRSSERTEKQRGNSGDKQDDLSAPDPRSGRLNVGIPRIREALLLTRSLIPDECSRLGCVTAVTAIWARSRYPDRKGM